jgi:hypothetical protein
MVVIDVLRRRLPARRAFAFLLGQHHVDIGLPDPIPPP